jgi:hypothetical protein
MPRAVGPIAWKDKPDVHEQQRAARCATSAQNPDSLPPSHPDIPYQPTITSSTGEWKRGHW